jgi:2-iminobutanoate/2-iminopropanoate deaminase
MSLAHGTVTTAATARHGGGAHTDPMQGVRGVTTVRAPAPLAGAPYSQAMVVGELVFTSGQTALDPRTGQLVEGGIREQTEQVVANLSAVLEEAGTSFASVVKATCWLADLSDWPGMNEVLAEACGPLPPARSAVRAELLGGALVEIEVVARL